MALLENEIQILEEGVLASLSTDVPQALLFAKLLYDELPQELRYVHQYAKILRMVNKKEALLFIKNWFDLQNLASIFQHQKIIELVDLYVTFHTEDQFYDDALKLELQLLNHKNQKQSPDRDHYAIKVIKRLIQMTDYDQALNLIQMMTQALQVELKLEKNQANIDLIKQKIAVFHQELGEIHEGKGNIREAIKAYSKACVYDDQRAMQKVSQLLNRKIPTWHFPMMNDVPRNEAFEQALINRIKEDDLVLDIGCGSGLLSLMSARAGAKEVYAIELETAVAKIASKIIEKNGFSDEITVINKRSTQLQAPQHLPLCDLLVCEIFDVSLLGEDALYTIAHAKKNLLKPGAKIVPQRLNLWCQAVDSADLRARYYVKDAQGFDLSEFNQLSDPRVLQLDLSRFSYQVLTEPTLAFTIDLEQDFSLEGQNLLMLKTIQAGRNDGLIFWYELILDEENDVVLSTSPHQQNTHWLQGFAPNYDHKKIQSDWVEKDQNLLLSCAYTRFLLSFDFLC